jgi:NAD(P)-dependent dehydrogenase (short-subunit alcohol dehydrogenase family)/acyl carrier protein
VQLAQRIGAEVLATAGSPEKRDLLRTLGVQHVMDSRSLAFAEEVRSLTGGKGVDVVLNSLAGEFITASLDTLANGGVFLELGKRGVMTPEFVARTRPDVRYHVYDLGAEAMADHALLRPMFDEILEGLTKRELQPLPVKVFPLERIQDAFRYMAQAKHIGKLVARPRGAGARHAPIVSGAATYWITGGLGGIGLETARWLVGLGAKTLVLSGRHAPSTRALDTIRELEQQGATVRIVAADAADRIQMLKILQDIERELPVLRGVVHAAGMVDDAPILLQNWDRMRQVLSGKAHGAFVLHELTIDLKLDFFVLYSAAGLLLGALGQSSYAAANAELDALAAARHQLGLPALSVAWGTWADVGMAAKLASEGSDVWSARGLGKITPAAGFASLERLMREDVVHAAVLPIDWQQFLGQLPDGAERSFFSQLTSVNRRAESAQRQEVSSLLSTILSMPGFQRRAALVAHLSQKALHVIGLDPKTLLNPKVPLKELGLDSLMAVELRNTLARSTGHPLPATLLFDYPTLDGLADQLMRVLSLDAEPTAGSTTISASATASAQSAVAELTDDEAEALLLRELDSSTEMPHGT